MKQEKLFDLLKAAVSPCECVKAAKQELLENGFEEIDYTGVWKALMQIWMKSVMICQVRSVTL